MNKEERKIYNAKYYNEKNDVIKAKTKEKVDCPICGTVTSKSNLYYHKKTKKCKRIREEKLLSKVDNQNEADFEKFLSFMQRLKK